MRDYLAGTTATSVWSMYKAGAARHLRAALPDGLRENQKLPQTVITPTTKARDGEHDEPLTAAAILDRGLLTPAQWREVSEKALALFARGREIAAERGLILVDTKYEFGLDRDGRDRARRRDPHAGQQPLLVRRELSRRFAAGEPPDSFDKDFLRRWVAARATPTRPDPADPARRRSPRPPASISPHSRRSPAKAFVAAAARHPGTRKRIRANLRPIFQHPSRAASGPAAFASRFLPPLRL